MGSGVRGLVEAGGEGNGRDSLGGTPLHDATWAGEMGVVRLLL